MGLKYPSVYSYVDYQNILFVDKSVKQSTILYDSANSTTFPVLYDYNTTSDEIMSLINNFNNGIRLAFAFEGSPYPQNFFNNSPIFSMNDLSDNENKYSKNMKLMLNIISLKQVTKIDFLACFTYSVKIYKDYYAKLSKNGVTIGASTDKTGNKNGDWIMESTNENILPVYFSSNIINYTSTLSLFYRNGCTNNANYMLDYNNIIDGFPTIVEYYDNYDMNDYQFDDWKEMKDVQESTNKNKIIESLDKKTLLELRGLIDDRLKTL